MRRRGFLAGLLLATTANVVTAQRRARPPQIGILDPGIPQLFDAFRDGMRSLGYVEGQNINTVLRSAQGRPADVQHLAAELAGLKVDVIVTAGTAPVRAAAEATSSIPIVFAALGDALASGIVTNLFRPGGNLTGLSFLNTEVSSKRLETLSRPSRTCSGSQSLLIHSVAVVCRSNGASCKAASRSCLKLSTCHARRPLKRLSEPLPGVARRLLTCSPPRFSMLIESGSRNLRWCTTFLRCMKRANMCGREA